MRASGLTILPRLLLLAALLLPAAGRARAAPLPSFTNIATLGYHGCLEPCALVITTTAGWRSFWHTYGYGPPPAISFARRQVVVIGRGEVPTTGYRVTVRTVTQSAGALQIEVREPLPRDLHPLHHPEWPTQVISVPAHLLLDLRISQQAAACPAYLWHVCRSPRRCTTLAPTSSTAACYPARSWRTAPPSLPVRLWDPSAIISAALHQPLRRVMVIQHAPTSSWDIPLDAVTFLYGHGLSVTEYPQRTVLGRPFLTRYQLLRAPGRRTPWVSFGFLPACNLTAAVTAPGSWRQVNRLGRTLRQATTCPVSP